MLVLASMILITFSYCISMLASAVEAHVLSFAHIAYSQTKGRLKTKILDKFHLLIRLNMIWIHPSGTWLCVYIFFATVRLVRHLKYLKAGNVNLLVEPYEKTKDHSQDDSSPGDYDVRA